MINAGVVSFPSSSDSLLQFSRRPCGWRDSQQSILVSREYHCNIGWCIPQRGEGQESVTIH